MLRIKNKKKNYGKAIAPVLCLSLMLTGAATSFASPKAFDASAVGVKEGNIYYEVESENHSDAVAMLNKAQTTIAEEAMILLKNENNALPVAKGSRVTVFGNGQSKAAIRSGRIDESLEKAGLTVNPTVKKFYSSSKAPSRDYTPGNGHFVSGYRTYEAPVSTFDFTPESADYSGYSDAAFVVFSRAGGEGNDLPTRMARNNESNWGGYDAWDSNTPSIGARSADDHYLQLDKDETDLLDHVCSNFDKVIVLINSFNAMELGFLDDPGHYAYHPEIKGAIFIGAPSSGSDAIGKVVTGEVTPSGHTVDTFVRDLKKDPTFQNYSKNLVADGNRYTYGSNNTPSSTYFIHYEEGIYVGYRYYETRGFDEGFDTPYTTTGTGDINGTTTKSWDSWYDAHTVFPMGYGKSYTTFDWELVESSPSANAALTKNGEISVSVRVKNSGTYSGKDVVQLYYTAPYYDGGIEKAHVVLSGFAKTKLLKPGESEVVTLTMKVSDMKSYDYSDANENGIKGYELEHGDYEIKVCRDAHTPVFTVDYTLENDIYYDVDEATGNKVENLYDDVSFNENGVKQYMSRHDFEATFPTSGTKYKQVAKSFLDKLNAAPVVNKETDKDKPWYTDEPVTFASDTTNSGIKLNHLIGRDYDDPLWEAFLNQMTREEMYAFPDAGFYETQELERLNKPYTRDVDGPWGFGGTNSDGHGLGSLCGPMISQTYNPDMAFLRGSMMAEAGYHGNRITGWYAPGMNIHRSAFSGRNNEYYGEDGYLSGIFAAYEIAGAKSKGMYSYAKHMFLNDQETNRDSGIGIVTWANEQSMRELYAKPFEIAVKLGKVQAVMSSFNCIGETRARYSWATLTGMLRNEWGFEGFVVTDWANGGSRAETDLMIRAGNDLRLGDGPGVSNSEAANTPTHERAIRNAVKNIMFTVCNSNAMNGVGFDWGNSFEKLPLTYSDFRVTVTKGAPVSGVTLATATAPGKADSVTYEVVEGDLPTGLSLSANGTLTGTVESTVASGLYTVTVRATDTTTKYAYGFAPATAKVSVLLQAEGESIAVNYEGSTLKSGVCGEDYSVSVATATVQSSDEETIVYKLANGSTLPAGLEMNGYGLIKGRPVSPVVGHKFKVIASVANSDAWVPAEAEFTITITGRMFLNARVINIYKNTDFERTLDLYVADTGTPSVIFALKDGSTLPEGVTLDKTTGKLSGKIATPGTYTFTVKVTGAGFTETEAEIKITVHEFKYKTK